MFDMLWNRRTIKSIVLGGKGVAARRGPAILQFVRGITDTAFPPGQSNLINHESDSATSDQSRPNARLSRILRQQRTGAGERLGFSACFWPCYQREPRPGDHP